MAREEGIRTSDYRKIMNLLKLHSLVLLRLLPSITYGKSQATYVRFHFQNYLLFARLVGVGMNAFYMLLHFDKQIIAKRKYYLSNNKLNLIIVTAALPDLLLDGIVVFSLNHLPISFSFVFLLPYPDSHRRVTS